MAGAGCSTGFGAGFAACAALLTGFKGAISKMISCVEFDDMGAIS
jgi:hypothetical protein